MRHFSKWVIVLLLGLFQALNPISAQVVTRDQCLLHLDKSFYVSGEIAWYKLYLPAFFRDKDLSVRVSVTDQAGHILRSHYLKNAGKTYVEGYYKVPFDLVTGMYHLVFEGADKAARKFERLAEAAVPMISDLGGASSPAAGGPVESSSATLTGNLQIEITLPADTFLCRDQIQPRIAVRDQNGKPVKADISVAVTDWELCGPKASGRSNIGVTSGLDPGLAGRLTNALYYRGQWLDGEGKPAAAKVAGAFSAEDQKLFYTNTDAAGTLFLELPDFYGSKTVQFLGWEKENTEISVRMDNTLNVKQASLPALSPEVADYLRLSAERKKIFQYYKMLETGLAVEVPETKPGELKPDMKVFPKEFKSFPNVATFFREVLRPITFTLKKDGTYDARIYNDQIQGLDEYYPEKPLFIVDNKITRDVDFVAKMDLSLVEQVDLFFRFQTLRSQFNVLGSNGVVRVITSADDIAVPAAEEEDIFTVTGLQPEAVFPGFEPSSMAAHQPFFRPQLYWNPRVETDNQGKATFSYYQSDEVSRFRIQVVAHGENGEYGIAERVYWVRMER
ncbi:MAG: hypothetical protein H6562_15815 [Lewinellaceae bacterium]|nr:hypothetical protein [Lewinellaceae bacterium]